MMDKKYLLGGLIGLGVGAFVGAGIATAIVLTSQNREDEEDTTRQAPTDEAILLDLDGDGEPDAVLEDLDGDGLIDTISMDTTGDGNVDTVMTDVDGDGEADAVCATEDSSIFADVEAAEAQPEEAPAE